MEQSSEPIRSNLENPDEAMLERIDVFVLGLGERIDGIQEAERLGALDDAAHLAIDLAKAAGDFGLPTLVEAADSVAAICKRHDAAAALDEIVELTQIVRRVRVGHSGF